MGQTTLSSPGTHFDLVHAHSVAIQLNVLPFFSFLCLTKQLKVFPFPS